MNDALENEIVLGQVYGYSTKDNVVIGKAIKLTDQKVTIEVIKSQCYLYGEPIKGAYSTLTAKTVSVFSWHLFPVKE